MGETKMEIERTAIRLLLARGRTSEFGTGVESKNEVKVQTLYLRAAEGVWTCLD